MDETPEKYKFSIGDKIIIGFLSILLLIMTGLLTYLIIYDENSRWEAIGKLLGAVGVSTLMLVSIIQAMKKKPVKPKTRNQ